MLSKELIKPLFEKEGHGEIYSANFRATTRVKRIGTNVASPPRIKSGAGSSSSAAMRRRRGKGALRVPLAVPYWKGDTYRKIFRAVFSGAVIDGAATENLRALICEMLKIKNALLCGSGSLALELALRVCGVEPGDEVVLPAFCCSALVPPILAAGAIPVLADVGAELNLTVETVAATLTRKTKAVIVPHLYGNPADMGPIVELAKERNIRVIDDAAQALGATIDGRPVGGFGDAGVLSFGREKICFGLGGGALLFQSNDILSRTVKCAMARPQYGPALQNLLSAVFWRRWRRWTLPLENALWRNDDSGPETPVDSYQKEKMSNLSATVALSLLRSLQENIDARRIRVRAYRKLLDAGQGLQLIPHRTGSACLTQVIRFSKKRRNEDIAVTVIQALRHAGYEVRGSYVPIHCLRGNSVCVWDDLRRTDRIWADLVELPCEPNVRLDDVERIATIVKTATNS